ncbi:MAG: four helix bundle protein [Flavobacteriales bacterium]
MFDFEKLEVYQICRQQNADVLKYIEAGNGIDRDLLALWKTNTLNIALNLVEGVGRIPKADKKHYVTIARGYVFECVALLHILADLNPQQADAIGEFYNRYESLSKMLLGMIRSFDN